MLVHRQPAELGSSCCCTSYLVLLTGCVCVPPKRWPQSSLPDQILSKQKGFWLCLQAGRSVCAEHTASRCPGELKHCQRSQSSCWKQHHEHSVRCFENRASLVLGVLDEGRSRTETPGAVCACGLLIQITRLPCYACFGLFFFFNFQRSRSLLRRSINTVTCESKAECLLHWDRCCCLV